MIPFPFNENRFSFLVADYLLVGQLCTNPKSDRSLLSCLKVTQCSKSEIGDAPLHNPCSLPIQVMTTGPLPAPSKCKSGLLRITGACPGWWKESFRFRLWSLVWFQVRATSCHLTSSKSAWKSISKCTWICWRMWWSPGGIRWSVTDPGWGSKTQVWLQKECYDFVPFSHWPPPPLTRTRWTTSFDHTSRTSPTWPPTTPNPPWSPSSAEHLWKRHAPSSGSVSRRWLRLTAAILNRCHLYFIIKLPELIFSIKVLK